MAKINISDKIFAFVPITTQTILGSHVQGNANFMALGWLTRCNSMHKPPMIAIAVNRSNCFVRPRRIGHWILFVICDFLIWFFRVRLQ